MRKINALALVACTAVTFGILTSANVSAANDKMMRKDDVMERMQKTEMVHEVAFTEQALFEAQASGKPYFVAFHKKGCPLCAEQKQALNVIYADPAYEDLKVLVVDYINDTASLKKFNVGMQGTLILYKGTDEVSRSTGLTKADDIAKQIGS